MSNPITYPDFNPQPKQGKKQPKVQKPIKQVNKAKPIPHKLVEATFVRDKYKCQYCAAPSQIKKQHSLNCNHIIRQSQGGKHVLKYLNACCGKCHKDHGTVSVIDKRWLAGEDVYKSGRMIDDKE
jgi:5-methylcytosine-specific restriction endonuclease McrA